jgi:RNA polymerase sigma factor (TIGR02999 family)
MRIMCKLLEQGGDDIGASAGACSPRKAGVAGRRQGRSNVLRRPEPSKGSRTGAHHLTYDRFTHAHRRTDPPMNSALSTGPQALDVTSWLAQWDAPSPEVGQRLFELLYDDIKRAARSQLRREDAGHTLSATALTHEAWFRMSEQTRTQWRNRGHFLAVASTMMRRILVNHELARRAAKREAELVPVTLSGLEQLGQPPDRDLVAVHEALLAFETIDARAAKVVELRFFGGLENDEIADALGTSLATVKRDWALARAWLHRELGAR